MSIMVDTPDRARHAVEFLASQNVSFIKIYNWVPEASLQVILDTAHQHGLRVTGHVPRTITMTRAIQLGMDCLEHIVSRAASCCRRTKRTGRPAAGRPA